MSPEAIEAMAKTKRGVPHSEEHNRKIAASCTGKRHSAISKVRRRRTKPPKHTGGAAYLGIPRTSKNYKAAQLLANWVLTPEAQNLIVGGTLNGMPVIPVSKLDPKLAAGLKGVDVANLRAPYLSANGNDLKSAWASYVPGK